MDVVAQGPLPVASRVWQTWSGTLSLTVVCKATHQLGPVESPLADQQDPPNEDDVHWNDDPRESLRFLSDLVPFKRRADVILVGHAHAPRGEPVRSLPTRLRVGEIDKSIDVWVDRVFTLEGQLREGPRFVKAPLLWHYAAGGPGTANPVGVRRDAPPDRYGQRMIPRLQPPGVHVAEPSDVVPTIGYGPISPTWPERWAKLHRYAAGWDPRQWYRRPLPDDIDPGYFNAAPSDQQLDVLRADERIVLDNLHPHHPHLATNLAGTTQPEAVIEHPGGRTENVRLVCDTMWIDTDRGTCSLTWRARIPIAAVDARVRVTVIQARPGERLARPAESEETTKEYQLGPRPVAPTMAILPSVAPAPSVAPLPFAAAEQPRRPAAMTLSPADLKSLLRGDAPGTGPVLPFRSSSAPPPTAAAPKAPDLSATPFVALTPQAIPRPPEPVLDEPTPEPLVAAPPPVAPPLFLAPPVELALPIAAPEIAEPEAPPAAAPSGLATTGAVAADEPPPPAVEAPRPRPPPAKPALPIDRFPLARVAAIAASCARTEAEAPSILLENEVSPDVWAALEAHWAEALRRDAERGRTAQGREYDRAYVARLEEERGPITAEEYAELVLAFERGRVEAALADLRLPRGALLRIQRVYLDRMSADSALGQRVRAALAAEADGEE